MPAFLKRKSLAALASNKGGRPLRKPAHSLTFLIVHRYISSTRQAFLEDQFWMARFGKQYFKSSNESAEMAYKLGVLAVSAKEYQSAYELFNKAAEAEHGSAYYNLFLLHGCGNLSTYDLDAAADCYYKAAAIEIAFRTGSGSPYFAYYLCHDYYCAVTLPGGAGYFGSPIEAALKTEEFRSTVSQAIMAFLVGYLKSALKIDASTDIASFSHNRAHTNTLSYVASLDDWFPIQHNDSESDDASERKVAAVNGGRCRIAEVIAVDQLSPAR